MSHIPYTETVFAIESSEMSAVFNLVHNVFLKNHFQVEIPHSSIWLEDIDDVDGDWYEFESVTYNPETQLEVDAALDKLKVHKTGGCLSYAGDKSRVWDAEHPDYGPYSALVCFGSLDNNTIEYVMMTVRESNFNHFPTVFNKICNEIFELLEIVGATRRINSDLDAYNECDIAEHIINDTFHEITLDMKLMTEFK